MKFDIVMTDINGTPVGYLFRNGQPGGAWLSRNLQTNVELPSGRYRHRYRIDGAVARELFRNVPNGIYPVFLYNNGGIQGRVLLGIMRGGNSG